MVKETQARLQSKGLGHLLDKPYDNPKRLRSFRSPPTENGTSTSRMLRAAVLAVFPGIDPSQLKELSAESTIMAGLEKDLLKYDEIQVSIDV
jgi:hypothetical protein